MEKEIKFVVMVPVYRAEAYLDECVRSVLNQTYHNFELLLVDDGSPDRCGEMCDGYAAGDDRVRVYHKPNGGLLHTRRFAIERAGMEGYCLFLDSDDVLLPHALETVARTVRQYDCDCVVFDLETFGEGVEPHRSGSFAEEPVLVTDKRRLYDLVLKEPGAYNSVCRKAVRLALLSHRMEDYAPYYGISVGEDRLQSLEIYRNSRSVCFIPDVLYRYRMNSASIMHTAGLAERKADFRVYEAEREMLEKDSAYAGEPFAAYRGARIRQVSGDLAYIACLPLPKAERTALYEKVRTSSYWRDFLDGGGYDRREVGRMALFYELFRRRRYTLAALSARIYRKLRRSSAV